MQEWNLREDMHLKDLNIHLAFDDMKSLLNERLASEEFAAETPTLRGTSVDYEIYSWSTEIVRPRQPTDCPLDFNRTAFTDFVPPCVMF